MMGQQPRTDSLFYYFRLEDQIPDDHLLKRLDRFIDFGFVRERLRDTYSAMGRPSIDPEVLLRLLLVGYLYGITSERRLMLAARRMVERLEKLGLHPECLGGDKAYGSGEFLAWLLERKIAPHIPVLDRRHQTGGHFTRDQFRYDPAENVYYCPEGKLLRYQRQRPDTQGYAYCSTVAQCQGCPQK